MADAVLDNKVKKNAVSKNNTVNKKILKEKPFVFELPIKVNILGKDVFRQAFLTSDNLTIDIGKDSFQFSIETHELTINNKLIFNEGLQPEDVGSKALNYFILDAHTPVYTFDYDKQFGVTIGKKDLYEIQIDSELTIQLIKEKFVVTLDKKQLEPAYLNEVKIDKQIISSFENGDIFVDRDFMLVKNHGQFSLVTNKKINFHLQNQHLILQKEFDNQPQTFPSITRSPRVRRSIPSATFQLKSKKKENNKTKQNSLLKAIVPPIGMLGITMLTAVLAGKTPLLSLGMGSLSLLTAGFTLSQFFSEKKQTKLEEGKNDQIFQEYLAKQSLEINQLREKSADILLYEQPSLQSIVDLMKKYSTRLYERVSSDEDFLTVSLGTGILKSSIIVTSDLTDEQDNSLSSRQLRQIVAEYQTQDNLPINISLLNTTLGVVGTHKDQLNLLENIFVQLTFFTSYHDLEYIVVTDELNFHKRFEKYYLLPHFIFSEFQSSGFIYNQETLSILSAFVNLIKQRIQQSSELSKNQKINWDKNYLFIIDNTSLIATHQIQEYLSMDLGSLGITVISFASQSSLLPERTNQIVQVGPNAQLLVKDKITIDQHFEPYNIPLNLEEGLQAISELVHEQVVQSSLPQSLTLLDQYFVKKIDDLKIENNWEIAQVNKSIKSVIGLKSPDDQSIWDLHERYHGPHALIGGTTGSGKSEFLTTYLIGLVINYSPSDISILIIDWKGGGIANTLAELPHFAGAITNLDGSAIDRALTSIHAELTKRQRIFSEFGVNNINDYQELFKQGLNSSTDQKNKTNYPTDPLPHLILVSDEFAELKANAPDFLDELTSVARIGRSLGVHLILATQKPSGVVNDQIETNSRSKIALKMANIQDSKELLKSEDAAFITNPGQGILKVGENEVYEAFQSGYSGAPYVPNEEKQKIVDERVYKLDALNKKQVIIDPSSNKKKAVREEKPISQLQAIIDHVNRLQKKVKYPLPSKPWLANLPEVLVVDKPEKGLKVKLGMLDIPNEQLQKPYSYDIQSSSHTVIFGSSGFGKSVTIQTIIVQLAKQNDPNKLVVDLLDFGTNGLMPLQDLPNVVDLSTNEQEEKLLKHLALITEELSQRRNLFAQSNSTNIAQYNKKLSKNEKHLPIRIVALDSYDTISEADSKLRDKVDQLLATIVRMGASLGVYLLISANRVGSIRLSLLSNLPTKIALSLINEDEYSVLFGQNRISLPTIPGRAQLLVNDQVTAIQIYQVNDGVASDYYSKLEEQVNEINQGYKGERPMSIPMVPDEVDAFEYISNYSNYDYLNQNIYPLGYALDTSLPQGINLENKFFMVNYEDEDQQILLYKRIAIMQQLSNLSLIVIDPENLLRKISIDKSIKYFNEETMENAINDIQKVDGKHPALIVVLNADKYLPIPSDEDFISLMKNGFESGKHFVLSIRQNSLMKMDAKTTYIKNNIKNGMLLMRVSEQNLVKQVISNEPDLALEEAYNFQNRKVTKIRFIHVNEE